MGKSRYHHGDLRATILGAAAEQIATEGVDAVSLRGLARRAGVSHAAPTHHFGDRAGLLTALAIEGFDLLGAELTSAGTDFREVAVAYVRFALRHPGHFDVMYRRDLLRGDDPDLAAARARSGTALRAGVAELSPTRPQHRQHATQLAAWSLVHGFAALWREGALQNSALATTDDPEALAREMLATVQLD
ncbi:TetR/AcrR family transcriptional regulator [Nocardia goodfellowii]|uniref:AcrR family transcriptional regulator n=1 Tax=Nocardia goodfellowii TaxID=882446 RepID=A0ABS4QDK5_9NOCA|nr:TetR/AcrR family transcriptional regulator [Nocardia goodfellowii]MBP2189780.1 AcrR family transcriptional regulator [Nocardia goodfellowii]